MSSGGARGENSPAGARRIAEMPMASLLAGVQVVSVGVADFAEAQWSQQVPCVHVDWAPPAMEDPEIVNLLERLL